MKLFRCPQNSQTVNSCKEESGLIQLRLKQHSFRKSKTEGSIVIKLKVLERVRIQESSTGRTNYFTVEVVIGGKTISTVEKTYQEFKFFQNTLITFLRGNNDELIDLPTLEQGLKYGSPMLASSGDLYSHMGDRAATLSKQEELDNIKRYCNVLSTNVEYQVGPFFTFFKIPGEAIIDDNEVDTSDYQENLNRSMSESSIAGEKQFMYSMSVTKWKIFINEDSSKFLVYFRVKFENFYKNDEGVYFYQFSVFSRSDDGAKFRIEKRFSEFITLEKMLQKSVKAKPPPLPKKVMMHNETIMKKRANELEEWLTIICNDKVYHCESLFSFISIPQDQLSLITTFPNPSAFRTVSCNVADHVSINTKEENFVVYNIKVEIFDKQTKERLSEHWVGRRFKEFSILHDLLKQKFQNYKTKLPELPSKLSAFSNLKHRQEQLNTYLKKLLTNEEFLDVLYFRKFLAIQTSMLAENFTKVFKFQ